MKNLRSLLSISISSALIALSPGFEPYRLAAQTFSAAPNAAVPVGPGVVGGMPVQLGAGVTGPAGANVSVGMTQGLTGLGAAPAVTPGARAAAGTLALPSAAAAPAAAAVQGGALARPGVATTQAARAPPEAVALASARPAAWVQAGVGANLTRPADRRADSAPTAFERLQTQLPDHGRMGAERAKVALDADAMVRTGEGAMGTAAGSVQVGAAAMWEVRGTGAGAAESALSRSSKKSSKMPDAAPGESSKGSDTDVRNLDELGNPRRQQSDGPDSVSDEFGGDRNGDSGGPLFAALPLALTVAGGAALAALGNFAMLPLYIGLIIPSLILHEMGHAKAADMLGDPTARLDGRMSFKPRNLLTHIDPVMTLLVPILTVLTTGFLFGGAKPVIVNMQNFRSPLKDMAKVALAGPAVNFGLALLAGVAHTAAIAIGMTGAVPALLTLLVFFNVMLGVFNLLPFAPLDGHHILRWALNSQSAMRLTRGVSGDLSAFLDRNAMMQFVVLMAALIFFGGPVLWLVKALTGVFLAGSAMLGTVQLASAALPALAAAGLMIGQIAGRGPSGPGRLTPGPLAPGPVQARALARGSDAGRLAPALPEPVTLIVKLSGAARPLPQDIHMSLVPDGSKLNGMLGQAAAAHYVDSYNALTGDLEAAGLARSLLDQHGAAAVASYKRINAATLVVPADKAAALQAALEARGLRVFPNTRRRIITPVPVDPNHPESPAPEARGAVTMQETLAVSNAGSPMEEGRKRWGQPDYGLGLFGRLTLKVLRLFGAKAPDVPVAVIDSGADTSHKLLKGIKEVKNVTNGPNVDDIGHGSWVHSLVLWYAPWLKSSTHYKTFVDGGATTDDVLKALTLAANDGNIIMSNSWGDDEGNPDGPDAQLVKKLAEEGRIMVFAAGNSGSGKNTIGAPAIVYHRDADTGAVRVMSVAATDRAKKVAYFSSRGPGSPITSTDEKYKDWPRRPDLAEVGYNTEGAWPAKLRPDRVDPALGPLKAISGTSMSTPKVAGTLALLAMLFGVTTVGPKLDAIAAAVMKTLVKGGDPNALGDGFNDVGAAFAELSKTMTPVVGNRVAQAMIARFVGGAAAPAPATAARSARRAAVVVAALAGGAIALAALVTGGLTLAALALAGSSAALVLALGLLVAAALPPR